MKTKLYTSDATLDALHVLNEGKGTGRRIERKVLADLLKDYGIMIAKLGEVGITVEQHEKIR
jgi:hypothetical protein